MPTDDAPLPPHYQHDHVLPYPRTHARQVTLAGMVLAAVAGFGLAAVVRNAHPADGLLRLPLSTAFIVGALLMVPVHEGLHVLAALLHGLRLRDIGMGFRRGFLYVQLRRSISVAGMRVVLLAPLVLMGLPLLIFSLRSGERQWIVLFAAHVGSTVADLYTFWRLRGLDPEAHVLHEPGVHGLTIWRRDPDAPPAPAEPVAALSMHALVGLAAGLLFMVGPFLVPDHDLLGDMVLSCRRSDRFVPEGWQGESFDFHVSDAERVLLTARVHEDGRLTSTVRRELVLDGPSGRLDLLWRRETDDEDRPGARLVIEAALGAQRAGLLELPHATADATSYAVVHKRRVRNDRQLRLLYQFVPDPPLPAGEALEIPVAHASGRCDLRDGLPPGTEVDVEATFFR